MSTNSKAYVSGSFTVGDVIPVSVTRYNSSYTHTVVIQNSKRQTIDTIATKSSSTKLSFDSGTSSARLSIYDSDETATSFEVYVVTTTFNGNTEVGTETTSFNISADMDDLSPSLQSGSVTLTETVEDVISITGNNKTVVQYVSRPKITAQLNTSYGYAVGDIFVNDQKATIVGGIRKDPTIECTIQDTSKGWFNIRVVTNRNTTSIIRVSYNTQSISGVSYIQYSPMTISSVSASRVTGGVSVSVSGKYTGYPGVTRPCVNIKIKENVAGSQPITISSDDLIQDVSGGSYVFTKTHSMQLDENKSYLVTFTVRDGIGTFVDGSELSVATSGATINKLKPVFDWGQDDFSCNVNFIAQDGIRVYDGDIVMYKDLRPSLYKPKIIGATTSPGSGVGAMQIQNVAEPRSGSAGLYDGVPRKYVDDRLPDYSTDEQKTGRKWIDGSDIYFKSYAGSFDVTANVTTRPGIDASLTNTNCIPINYYGFIREHSWKTSGSATYPISLRNEYKATSTTNREVTFNISSAANGGINLIVRWDATNTFVYVLTVEYIKQ